MLTLMIVALMISLFIVGYFLIRIYFKTIHQKKRIAALEIQLLKDMDQHKALENKLLKIKEKLEHDALYDLVTGLAGRQVFEDRLNQILKQSERNQLVFGIMIVDLDGFKLINSALGRDVADNLLKEVALRLQNLIRQADSASHLSGDEFGLLLSYLTKPEMAAYVAQRILDAISQPFTVEGHDQDIYITASIGIATYPLDGEDAKILLKKADNAMHQAKARGRNTFQFYRPEMHTLSQRDLMLSSSLQKADVFDEFKIFYQPTINTETNKIFTMQALLYWQHADYGIIEPQDFLWLAENNNRIVEIGEWLLHQVLNQFLTWKKNNFHINTITVSVSLRQVENPRFAYKLAQMFQEINIDPTCLILEISETALPPRLDFIEKVLNMLKHLGVQIAIKNFGTGHLSLQYLQRFPIDYLKIGDTLVKEITTNKDNEAMVNMIIMLAKSLQLFVVAEGVETFKQKQLLIELGCYIIQGSLFSPPLQPEEVTNEKLKVLIEAKIFSERIPPPK